MSYIDTTVNVIQSRLQNETQNIIPDKRKRCRFNFALTENEGGWTIHLEISAGDAPYRLPALGIPAASLVGDWYSRSAAFRKACRFPTTIFTANTVSEL